MVAKKKVSIQSLRNTAHFEKSDFRKLRGPEVEYVGEGDMASIMFYQLIKNGVNVVSFLTPDKQVIEMPKSKEGIIQVVPRENLPSLIGSRGDYSVMAFYSSKIPEDVLERLNGDAFNPITGRFFNLHPSLLPEYEGVIDPVKKMIQSGRKFTGVSMHLVNAHLDNGPVVGQRQYAIADNWNRTDGKKRLQRETELTYLTQTIPAMAQLCRDITKRMDKVNTINQWHDIIIPERSYFMKKQE